MQHNVLLKTPHFTKFEQQDTKMYAWFTKKKKKALDSFITEPKDVLVKEIQGLDGG